MSQTELNSTTSTSPSYQPSLLQSADTEVDLKFDKSRTTKRAVARRACLTCREKKIKCDGEAPLQPGTKKPHTTKVCSNCKYLGIECVFVQSNRGGRRRAGDGVKNLTVNSIGASTPPPPLSDSGSDFTKPPLSSVDLKVDLTDSSVSINMDTRNQLNYLHSRNQEILNHIPDGSRSPSLESQSLASETYYRNQIPYRGEYSEQHEPSPLQYNDRPRYYRYYPRDQERVPDHFMRQSAPPHSGPPPPPNGPPPPPFSSPFHSGIPHHHGASFGYPPPPPPPPPSLSRGPPYRFDYETPPPPPGKQQIHYRTSDKRLRQLYDQYHLPPPQTLLPPISHSEQLAKKTRSPSVNSQQEPHSDDESGKIKKPLKSNRETYNQSGSRTDSIDRLYAKYNLPDAKTCSIFLDLFYRYILPSFPVFSTKREFLERFSPKIHASLYHAIFTLSAKYAPPSVITIPEYRDADYWLNLVDRHWSNLDTSSALCGLLLLFRYYITVNRPQESFDCIKKILDIAEVYGLRNQIQFRDPDFYEQLLKTSTKEQLKLRLQLVSLIWYTWHCYVFQNAAKEIPSMLMKFPTDIEFPASSYNQKVLNWHEVKSMSGNEDEMMRLETSQFVVVVSYMVDEFTRLTINIDNFDFDYKLNALINIAGLKLYRVTSMQTSNLILDRKIIVVDSDMLKSSFTLHELRILINVPMISSWFMFKPLKFMNDFYKYDDFEFNANALFSSILKNFNLTNIQIFFKIFKSSLSIIKLLNLGYGSIDEADGTTPVVIGPTTFESAYDIEQHLPCDESKQPWWSNFDDPNIITAIKDSDIPDAWVLFPFLAIRVIAKNIAILLSITLASKFMIFQNSPTNPTQLICQVFKEPLTEAEHASQLTHQTLSPLKELCLDASTLEFIPLTEFNLNRLLSDLRLSYKYLRCQSRYSTTVDSGIGQIEKIVGYVDQVLRRIG